MTIQSRLADKNFLTKYYNKVVLFGETALSDAIKEAINHRSMESEEHLIAHLEINYYPAFLKDDDLQGIFFCRMQQYLGRLEDEKNIMSAIDMIFPHLKGVYIYSINDILAELLPKINSQAFLTDYIGKLFRAEGSFTVLKSNLAEKLAAVCTLPQLEEETILTCFQDMIAFQKETLPRLLSFKMMPALCLGITSKDKIDFWLNEFLGKLEGIENEKLEWFENELNLMYFECFLILLVKNESDEKLIHYLDKFFWLYLNIEENDDIKSKLDQLLNKILPYIKSKELYDYLLAHLVRLKTPESHFNYFPAVFFPLANQKEMGLLMKILERKMKGKNVYSEELLECISLLLLKLPQNLFKDLSIMLLTIKDDSTPECIKNFVKESHQCQEQLELKI